METVAVRLSEGVHEAVKELAAEVGINKSDMATLLLFYGLAGVREGTFSEKTMGLVTADLLESWGSFTRATAKMRPDEKARFDKEVGAFFERLAKVLPWKA